MLYNGNIDIFWRVLNEPPLELIMALKRVLSLCLVALPVSFSPFAPVQCLYNLPSHMMRSENPGHLSNGFLSVDSSWVHGPAFSDVCSMQQHWTAHLSQPQAPLNKHFHPGPISEMHFGAAAVPVMTSTEQEKHYNHFREM